MRLLSSALGEPEQIAAAPDGQHREGNVQLRQTAEPAPRPSQEPPGLQRLVVRHGCPALIECC